MAIFITADFLMTKESEQYNNVRWLFDFLDTPIKHAVGNELIVNKFISSGMYSNFEREVFFKKSQGYMDSFNKLDIQFFFEEDKISDESIEYLREFFSPEDIVISYELSQQTRDVLDRACIRYIDIWLHPVRYLDDLLYGFYSNVKSINARLKSFDLDKEMFYTYANLVKVGTYKGYRRVDAKIEKNSLIFVGQTNFDKAVFCNGKMLNALDFKEEIKLLAEQHEHVYYLRHPFVKEGDEEVVKFFKGLHNYTEFVGDPNSYSILAHEEAVTFCTISSSLAVEAKYFGKSCKLLYRPVIDIDNVYSTVSQDFLFSHFWSEILKEEIKVKDRPALKFDNPHSKIRDSLSSYWSYREIDKLELTKKTLGTVFKRIKNDL